MIPGVQTEGLDLVDGLLEDADAEHAEVVEVPLLAVLDVPRHEREGDELVPGPPPIRQSRGGGGREQSKGVTGMPRTGFAGRMEPECHQDKY